MGEPDQLGSSEPPTDRSPFTISVAMATYSGAEHLAEQLESLAAHTLFPCESVVTDVGSTDDTPEIVWAFPSTAPLHVDIHSNTERLGYSSNFLRASNLCCGDLIAFCDQDDCWLPSKLESCAQIFEDDDTAVVVHSAEAWIGETKSGRLSPFLSKTENGSPGITECFFFTPGFAVASRRKILKLTSTNGQPDCWCGFAGGSVMAHDAWIWLLRATSGKLVKLRVVPAHCGKHGPRTVGAPVKCDVRGCFQLALSYVNHMLSARFEGQCAAALSRP